MLVSRAYVLTTQTVGNDCENFLVKEKKLKDDLENCTETPDVKQ